MDVRGPTLPWMTLAIAAVLLSCSNEIRLWPVQGEDPSLRVTYENHLRRSIRELQKVAEDIEEFGTISASSATLVRDPKKRFAFELGLGAKELFERNRLEGASALRDLFAYSARGALRVVPAPAAAAAAAASAAETAYTEPATGAAESDEGADPAQAEAAAPEAAAEPALVPVPALPPGAPASGTLPTQTFTPGQQIASDALSVGVRDLVKLTSDDVLTQKLLEWMSAPEFQASNKILYAAVLSVSIRPGWRTYTGYTGEIDLRAGFWCAHPDETHGADAETRERRKECIGDDLDERSPLAFAAFPAIDAQVLDERASLREQVALALTIEAQAPEASGALDQELVRRLEHDIATRSAVNTLAGYNESGLHFGWRFSPKAVAQFNPADPDSPPGLLLQPQSFPALVFLVADKSDVPKQFGGMCPDSYAEKAAASGLPGKIEATKQALEELKKQKRPDAALQQKLGGELQAFEQDVKEFPSCPELIFDSILFDYSMRWSRGPDAGADASWVPFRGGWSRWRRPELPDLRYADWAAAIMNARAALVWARTQRLAGSNPYSDESAPELEYQLEKKLNQIRTQSIKVDVVQQLPKITPEVPTISAVTPRAVVSAPLGNSWFVIVGKGFLAGGTECPAKARPIVNVSGADAVVQDGCTDSVLVATVESKNVQPITGKADVAVVATNGKTAILKDALTAVASAGLPTAAVDIGWVVGADGSAHVTSISTRGQGTTALDVVKALSEPPRKRKGVDLDLQLKASEKGAY